MSEFATAEPMITQPVVQGAESIGDAHISRRAVLTGAVLGTASLFLDGCTGGSGHPATSASAEASHAVVAPSAAPSAEASASPANPNTHHDLLSSGDESLVTLGQHEKELGREFHDLMFFLPTPTTPELAEAQAGTTAEKLKKFKEQGVTPFVVMEPTSAADGGYLDLHKLPKDEVATFFKKLREAGVTDETMGTWTFLPKANTPMWSNGPVDPRGITDPSFVKKNFTDLNEAMKKVFPGAKSAILLNSTTYQGLDWSKRDKGAPALLQYVDGLKDVDELCFQGLPWGNDTTDPALFLQASVATAVAARMGGPGKVKIRLNTGTYSQQTNPDNTTIIDTMTDEQRITTLERILIQAEAIKKAGYATTLQMFGENKMPDEADWSYGNDPAAQAALKDTFDKAAAAGIDTTIFG